MGYLDNAGLAHLWANIKSALAEKQDIITAGAGLIKDGDTLSVDIPVHRMLLQDEYDALTDEEKRHGLFFIQNWGGESEETPEETPEESVSYAGEEDETLETELPEGGEEDSWAEEDEWVEDTAEEIIIIDSIRLNGELIGLSASNIEGLPSGGVTMEQVNAALAGKQNKLTGTQGQVVGFDGAGNAVAQDASPSVGYSMAGQTVEPTKGTTVTAGEGAEIFNDYRERTYSSTFPTQGNIASGVYSHSEGTTTTASGDSSHAEGRATTASGESSHAEGSNTRASGNYSHAEGSSTTASGYASHAEGSSTKAIGGYSHAEGANTKASRDYSHVEGANTTASGNYSHAEGFLSTASGEASHAEGGGTASGSYSHAEGGGTASGSYSHAGGEYTVAEYKAETAIGRYNVQKSPGNATTINDLFVVGKGTSASARANAFRVDHNGVYGTGAFNASGADYAELFEWQDGNPDSEDRAGLFVTLDGERIRIAGPDDGYILGIVSATPSVVGDVYDDQWQGMEVRDVFGRTVTEMRDFPADIGPDGEEITPARRELAPKLNPDYDYTIKYQPRTQRPEWAAVGLLGKLVAVDDGSCQVNGWAAVGKGGKATASAARTKYRVMARLDAAHVKLMIL